MQKVLPLLLLSFAANTLGETVIPIEVQYGNPVATALIGDLEVRLVVDSGGLSLELRPEIAAKLDLEQLEEKISSTDTHGVTTESDAFIVPSIAIGGTEFSNVAAFESPLPPPVAKRTPRVDGILGRDFLNKYIVIYNYSESKIILYDNSEIGAKECHGTNIPLIEHSTGIIASEADLDHGTVTAIWDTGATHSFIKAHIAKDRDFPLVQDEDETEFYRSKRFSVGGSEFGPLEFVALPFVEPQYIDVFVGRNFFAEHVVCVNPFDRSIRIRANP